MRGYRGWVVYDAGSKNGLWLDNACKVAIGLSPGLELGTGSLTLIAESKRSMAVHALVARLLGWNATCRPLADRALRAIRSAPIHQVPRVEGVARACPIKARA